MTETGVLTNDDHGRLTAWLYDVLKMHKSGEISETSAMTEIAHVVGAVDIRNIGEIRAAISRRPK